MSITGPDFLFLQCVVSLFPIDRFLRVFLKLYLVFKRLSLKVLAATESIPL